MSEPAEERPGHGLTLSLIGHPGAFLDWGTRVIGEALAAAGWRVRTVLLTEAEAAPTPPDEARLLLANGPVVTRDELAPFIARTIVLLDDPARAFRASILRTADPSVSVRDLSALLAPLAGVVRQPGTVLIQRPLGGDPTELRSYVAGMAVPGLAAAEGGPDIELAPAEPLGPVARALLRQTIRPMHDFAIGTGGGPIILPLACFYSSERPDEQAPPLTDAAGPGRAVYYGPYLHMPRGRWRIEADCYFSQELRGAKVAVDVFTGTVLARAEFEPPAEGHFKAVFRTSVPNAGDRLEVRLWLVHGVINGMIGLRHVAWFPDEGAGK